MTSSGPIQKSHTPVRFLLFFFSALFVASAAIRPLWEPDEGRYTGAALQMLERGDWIHPQLNPEQPHFSKPPMVYWSVMLGLRFFGCREWAARLPNMVSWIAILFLLVQAGRRFMPDRSHAPALIFASSVYTFLAFSFITPDILLSLWEALAAAGFLFARYRSGRKDSRFWLMIAFTALGLGFLTKGPPALLPWLAWWISARLLRDEAARRQSRWLPGILLFLAVGFSWYLVVILQEPRLLDFFLRGEVAERMLTSAHSRNPQWYKGFQIYGSLLAGGFLPWTLAALVAWIPAWRRVDKAWLRRLKETEPWTVFFLVWLGFSLVLFCLVPSRLPLYILPLSVPVAWLLGRFLPERYIFSGWSRKALVLWGCLLLAFVIAAREAEIKEDARAFAEFLQQANLLPADEIVFVGVRPYYGLAFYIGLEVERCELTDSLPLPGAPYKKFETVLDEVLEDRETLLWAVRKEDVEPLTQQLQACACLSIYPGPAYR
ncbi:MAG: glycosyltransferase family 39 protein, partial [Verrucomicrobia bacterium]|nr:glycosyltransferase family 39 protein [Verrucomicrobiota bacterium]